MHNVKTIVSEVSAHETKQYSTTKILRIENYMPTLIKNVHTEVCKKHNFVPISAA